MNLNQIDYSNQEKIVNTLKELTDDQREQLNREMQYLLPLWIGEHQKREILLSLPESDKKLLFQSILLMSCAKTWRDSKDNQPPDSGREVIASLVWSIKDGDNSKIEDLNKEFHKRANQVREDLIDRIEQYKRRNLPEKKRKQVAELEKQEGKAEIVNRVIEDEYRKNEAIKRLEDYVKMFDLNVAMLDVSAFDAKTLELNEEMAELLIQVVSNPRSFVPVEVDNIMNDRVVTNKWYWHDALTVAEYRELCENLDDAEMWNQVFSKVFTNIQEKIRVPVTPLLARQPIIQQILDCLKDKLWEAAQICSYVEIEGLLWDLAIEVHRIERIFDGDDKHLVEKDSGAIFESTRIRDAVERTALNNYVDTAFVKDFCHEIYEERNPVLHGRCDCAAKCTGQATCLLQKLMTIDYLLGRVIEVRKDNIFKAWDSMPEDVKSRLLSTFR